MFRSITESGSIRAGEPAVPRVTPSHASRNLREDPAESQLEKAIEIGACKIDVCKRVRRETYRHPDRTRNLRVRSRWRGPRENLCSLLLTSCCPIKIHLSIFNSTTQNLFCHYGLGGGIFHAQRKGHLQQPGNRPRYSSRVQDLRRNGAPIMAAGPRAGPEHVLGDFLFFEQDGEGLLFINTGAKYF